MVDIFLSYSSKHRDLTRALAEALKAQGFSVWWDTELEAYDTFRAQIDAALSTARIVVVIWSDGAAASDYVVAEARESLALKRLVNCHAPGFDPWKIPKPFGEYQSESIENLDALLRAIHRRWSGEAPQRIDLTEYFERVTRTPLLSPKRETIGTVTSVTPSLLLNARLALAPYLDVHGLRGDMAEWAQSGRAVRGRLIHGPGGLGKTRLLAEVCADLRSNGWAAGFVERPPAENADIHRQALEQLIDSDRGDGVLLVLDYAERRHEEAARYAELMANAARARPQRLLRMVLLSRAAGDWWDRATADNLALQRMFDAKSVIELMPFPDQAARLALFEQCVDQFRIAIAQARAVDPDAFAGWIDLAPRPIPTPLAQSLGGEAFARPLMIQIAALLHLQGETPDGDSVASLLDGMLGSERRYWRAALGAEATDLRQTAVARGAVQATLLGGAQRADLETLLLKDAYFNRASPADAAEPLADLERLYGDAAGAVVPLEPDLVGEHLTLAHGDDRLIDTVVSWGNADRARALPILTVLNRATRSEHGSKAQHARIWLERIIRTCAAGWADPIVRVALETPGEIVRVLEEIAPELEPMAADGLLKALPDQTIKLGPLAALIAERSVVLARARLASGTESPARKALARAIRELAGRLSAQGRREEAVTASAEALAIYRELAAQSRDAFLPDLAWSLINLGSHLSHLGRREEALTVSAEAVAILRELAAQNRDAFLPNLATSLNNLGSILLDLGRREEALTANAEAAAIRRELAAQDRDTFLHDLATSLNNQGICLKALGRIEEALTAFAEGVELDRELAAQKRDAFLPHLATSLSNLGVHLSTLRRFKEALTASAEALAIRRELVAQNRNAFLPDLATSLINWGSELFGVGRHEEALTASSEALELLRELAATNRDAFLPDLATSLSNLGVDLSGLGRHEEALTASTEALEIRRELAAQSRDAFLPDLANSLVNMGARLSAVGRREEALTVRAEALELLRELAATNRDAFLPDLAGSLNHLGGDLSDLGRHEEALTASAEAVEINRELAAQSRDAFLPNLATSLTLLGSHLSALDRHEEALTASAEAVATLRELAAQNRDAFLRRLATSLSHLVSHLSEIGRHEEALTESAEALAIYRELTAQNRDAFLPDLATSLSVHGVHLRNNERPGEAVAFYLECAELLATMRSDATSEIASLADANARDLLGALRDAGSSNEEIARTFAKIGLSPGDFESIDAEAENEPAIAQPSLIGPDPAPDPLKARSDRARTSRRVAPLAVLFVALVLAAALAIVLFGARFVGAEQINGWLADVIRR